MAPEEKGERAWAEHVERCAGNIIIARPVEVSSDFSDAVGELEAA